jgi:hypothetical protein
VAGASFPAITAEMERLDVAAQRLEMMTMGMLSLQTPSNSARRPYARKRVDTYSMGMQK